MRSARSLSLTLACLATILFAHAPLASGYQKDTAAAGAIPSPSQALGFPVGADRQLADYHQIVSYLKRLASASPRIRIERLGETTLGNEFIMAVISSPQNLKNVQRYKEIARRLHDPRGLSQEQIGALVREGKAIVLVTCSIHASEIGASQMAMEWAHALVTANDPETLRRLDNVILLLVPSLNPDGQIMETEWYRKWVGTQYEGGRLPWLYHHYVGHDNNRDWYMLTQKETIALNRAVYHEWFPTVWLDEHQMGSNGPRIFVPPYADPVAHSLDALIFRGLNLIGTNMAWRLEEAGKSGVIYGYSYDAYWPGGTRNTAWWKNIFGLLTEVASARMATPAQVEPSELSGGRKGLIEYTKQINYPNPWPGGTWRLRDIMDYERIVSDALLETAAQYREDFLRGQAKLALEAVTAATPGEHYRISTGQRDPVTAARLAHLMRQHGVEVLVSADGKDFLIPAAQPYGRFVTEMFSRQRYPEVRPAQGSEIMPPYDVAAWSLPLMMDVNVEKVTLTPERATSLRPITDADWPPGRVVGQGSLFAVLPTTNNATRLVNAVLKNGGRVSVTGEKFAAVGREFPPGTFLIEAAGGLNDLAAKYHLEVVALAAAPHVAMSKLRPVRIGLYKPWLASIDEGWTRWLLEQYEFEVKSLDNKSIRAGNLNAQFDAIILPDVDREVILDGRPHREEGSMRYFEELPPEYQGGIGREGAQALKDFVARGGTLIALASAGDFIMDQFNVPVRNVLARVRSSEFLCPGSLLRIHLDPANPIAYGMGDQAAAFLESGIAYQTAPPGGELQRSVAAWYPSDAEDVLLAGWIRGAERLERRAAVVSFKMGRGSVSPSSGAKSAPGGKLVLFGFRVQHRAQTEGTFKLLFNAIRWAGMD